MRSAIRATAILTASSVVVVVTGIVATKVRATLLGPTGMGQLALLQSVASVGILIFGLGLSGSLPRFLTSVIQRGDFIEVGALRRTTFRMRLATIVAALATFVAVSGVLSRTVLGGAVAASAVIVVGACVALGLLLDIQQGLLVAYHRVRQIAAISATTAIGGAAASVVVIGVFRQRGIAASILATAVVSLAISTWYVRRSIPRPADSRTAFRQHGRRLLGFGFSYMASQLVGGGVAVLVPVMVLDLFSLEDVAYYQAAVTIAGTYLGFLIGAMASDYYPRVSAARTDPVRLRTLMVDQQRLVMLIAVPVLLLTITLVRPAVTIVYTHDFAPAAGILDWLLVGDLFKFASWTLSYVILARARPTTFLLLELFGGSSYLGLSFVGARLFGLPGLGMAWLVGYLLYLLLCLWICGRDIGATWTLRNLAMLGGGVAVVASVPIIGYLAGDGARLAVGLPLFMLAALYSARQLRREYKRPPRGDAASPPFDEEAHHGRGDFLPGTAQQAKQLGIPDVSPPPLD